MFIRFHSDAYEDITYFGNVAKQLLALMGHSGAVPGAFTADQIPEALHNLQEGLEREKKKTLSFKNEDDEGEINLTTRATPLLHMLQSAVKSDCSVLWSQSKSP